MPPIKACIELGDFADNSSFIEVTGCRDGNIRSRSENEHGETVNWWSIKLTWSWGRLKKALFLQAINSVQICATSQLKEACRGNKKLVGEFTWIYYIYEPHGTRTVHEPGGRSLERANRAAKAMVSLVAPRPISPLIGRPSNFIRWSNDMTFVKTDIGFRTKID